MYDGYNQSTKDVKGAPNKDDLPYRGPKIESCLDWLKYQGLTFNFANVALLIAIIIISTNINSTLQQQQTANAEAQASLGKLQYQIVNASTLITDITQGKDFFINHGFSNFSQLVKQYKYFNSSVLTLQSDIGKCVQLNHNRSAIQLKMFGPDNWTGLPISTGCNALGNSPPNCGAPTAVFPFNYISYQSHYNADSPDIAWNSVTYSGTLNTPGTYLLKLVVAATFSASNCALQAQWVIPGQSSFSYAILPTGSYPYAVFAQAYYSGNTFTSSTPSTDTYVTITKPTDVAVYVIVMNGGCVMSVNVGYTYATIEKI